MCAAMEFGRSVKLARMKWLLALVAGLAVVVVGVLLTAPRPEAGPPEVEESPVDVEAVAAQLRAEVLPAPFDALARHATPKTPPRDGEWLDAHPEEGQSFAGFCREVTPAKGRAVYLVPVGAFTEPHAAMFDSLEPLVRAWLLLEVRRLPAIAGKDASVGQRKGVAGNTQWHTETILELLRARRPDDAAATMGITSVDLYPDPAWNFVYSQASYDECVGISSLARDGEGGADEVLFRRRAFTTTVHEVGHMLGLAHCVAWECAMNGSNHRVEADSRPLEPCPACLAKLQRAVGFDLRARWDEVERAYQAAGLRDGVEAVRAARQLAFPDAGP